MSLPFHTSNFSPWNGPDFSLYGDKPEDSPDIELMNLEQDNIISNEALPEQPTGTPLSFQSNLISPATSANWPSSQIAPHPSPASIIGDLEDRFAADGLFAQDTVETLDSSNNDFTLLPYYRRAQRAIIVGLDVPSADDSILDELGTKYPPAVATCICPACERPFAHRKDRRRHMDHYCPATIDETQRQGEVFTCRCGRRYPKARWSKIKDHQKSCQAGDSGNNYYCPCRLGFADFEAFERHRRSTHMGRRGRPPKNTSQMTNPLPPEPVQRHHSDRTSHKQRREAVAPQATSTGSTTTQLYGVSTLEASFPLQISADSSTLRPYGTDVDASAKSTDTFNPLLVGVDPMSFLDDDWATYNPFVADLEQASDLDQDWEMPFPPL